MNTLKKKLLCICLGVSPSKKKDIHAHILAQLQRKPARKVKVSFSQKRRGVLVVRRLIFFKRSGRSRAIRSSASSGRATPPPLQQRSCCSFFFATKVFLHFFFSTGVLLQFFCNIGLFAQFFFATGVLLQFSLQHRSSCRIFFCNRCDVADFFFLRRGGSPWGGSVSLAAGDAEARAARGGKLIHSGSTHAGNAGGMARWRRKDKEIGACTRMTSKHIF